MPATPKAPQPYPPQADPATRPLEDWREPNMVRRPGEVMFGVFLPCQSWGQWATLAPSEAEWTYAYNRRVTRLAEEIGLHFALPASRWKGIPGDHIDWRGASLDTVTLAAALLEATSRITVMATMHTNIFHPVVAAKICADLDQISDGRFALNIVSGWNEEEFKSMSVPLLDHKERYAYTREWLAVIRALWADGACTHEGRYFQVREAVARPRPVQRNGPVLVNAGQSYTGMTFAAEEVDFLFSYGESAQKFRGITTGNGSKTGFVGLQKLVLRPTQAAAEALAEDIYAKRDIKAIRGMRIASGAATEETVDEWLAGPDNVRNFMFERGAIGAPEHIAEALARYIVAFRPDGVCLTLFDYVPELELFGAKVMPLLDERLAAHGMRIAPPPPAPAEAIVTPATERAAVA